MHILKKRLLPLLLATCISTGTVSTCDAGWDFWNNATVKSCVATCMTKLGFLKSKNTLDICGVVLIGAIVAGILYKNLTRTSRTLSFINLEAACKKNDYDKVKAILDENEGSKDLVSWMNSDTGLRYSLYDACKSCDLRLLELLICRLPDKKLVYVSFDESILEGALQNEGKDERGESLSTKIFEFLVEGLYKDLDYSQKDKDIFSPIHAACKRKRLDLVNWLVEAKKMDVNLKCLYDRDIDVTPLDIACESGDLEIVKYLISKGANFEAKAKGFLTLPIHFACKGGHLNIVEYFEKELKIEINEREKKICLFFAVQSGNLKLFNHLGFGQDLAGENQLTHPNRFIGKTLLEVAIESENQNFEIIKYLLERKKQSDIENKPKVNTIHNTVKTKKKEIKFERVFGFIEGEELHDFKKKFKVLGLGCESKMVESLIYKKEFKHEFTVTI